MPESGALELLDLQRSMRRIAHATEVHSRRIDRQLGLSLPQLSVLACVRELGADVTSRAIAAAAHLSPPTVVGILDKLELKGMIRRERSISDRRVVHAHLTETGAQALATFPMPAGEAFRAAFLAMGPEARVQILNAFHRIAEMMEAAVPPSERPAGLNPAPEPFVDTDHAAMLHAMAQPPERAGR
jgi:DNA-binding MarR family transcriptional regulator